MPQGMSRRNTSEMLQETSRGMLNFYDFCASFGIPKFLDSGRKSWTLGSGHWTLDAVLWALDSGRWILDSGRWTLNSGR